MARKDPTSVIEDHLNVAQFGRTGVIRRLRVESGFFVAILVAGLLIGLASGVVFSVHGFGVFLLASIPSLALIVFGLWVDRHEPEPAWLLMRCLIWGGTLSILVAGVLNSSMAFFISETSVASLVAPLVEETIKAVAILWLLRHHRSHMNGGLDAILYALFVGVGFTIVEDFSYYMESYADPDSEVFLTVLGRLPSTLLHPLFTSIVAVGLVMGLRREGFLRFLYPAVGFAAAVVLHGMWNSDIPFELRAGLFLPLTLGLILLTIRYSRTIEKSRIELLVDSSSLSESQADALRRTIRSAKPGLIEWLAATRDPSHTYHLKWRILQLAWIATTPEYAVYLARFCEDPQPDPRSIQSEAIRQLRDNLETLIQLQLPSDDAGLESDSSASGSSVMIWGSNAAILWSLLLTPAFGAYIQMRNWQALGRISKERASRYWLAASVAVIPLSTLIGLLESSYGEELFLREIFVVLFFIVWYFAFAKSQSSYLNSVRCGPVDKRPWMGILFLGFVINVVVFYLDSVLLSGFSGESVAD